MEDIFVALPAVSPMAVPVQFVNKPVTVPVNVGFANIVALLSLVTFSNPTLDLFKLVVKLSV